MTYKNRTKESTASTSTAVLVIAGAATGYRTFAAGPGIGATGVEVMVGPDSAGAWLIGEYTVTDANTLTRTAILDSSAGGGDVTLAAGTKEVFATVSAAALCAGLVDPNDVGFDIIGCFGQSNMEGNPASDALIDVGDAGQVFQWANASADTATYRKIITGVDPLYMPGGIRTGKTGLATWAAKAYLGTIPRNRKILLVPCAVGSSGLVGSFWQAGSPGGTYYERAITESNLAITAAQLLYPSSRFVGAWWAQGEADGLNGTTQAQYAAGLKAVIAGFRSRITGAADSWFVISPLTPEGITAHTGEVVIDLAHTQVAAEINKCVKAAPISGYSADVHWTAPGVRIIGSRLGRAAVAAKVAVGSDVTAPIALSASVANATPTFIDILFGEAMDTAITPAASAVTASGHVVSTLAWLSASVLRATVSAAYVNGEAASTAAYTQPGANQLRDTAGNLAANFAGLAITNNVAPVDVTAPAFSSAQVANATPSVIQITMGEALADITPATSAFNASGGRTATAFRTVISALAGKGGARIDFVDVDRRC